MKDSDKKMVGENKINQDNHRFLKIEESINKT